MYLYINLYFTNFTLMTGFVVQGDICVIYANFILFIFVLYAI